MFNTILVATDDSDHAIKAVKLAGELAEKYRAKLIVAHVLEYGRIPEGVLRMLEVEHLVEPHKPHQSGMAYPGSGLATATVQDQESDYEAARMAGVLGEQIVQRAKTTARDKGVSEISTRIMDGDPAHGILECAEKEQADLIVIGSRGLSDLKGLLMGSVSHKVCQLAKCTCLTVM